MRILPTILLAVAVVAASATAAAAGTERERVITPEAIARAPSCERFIGEPRDAISVAFRWDQRLSLAGCMQSIAVEPFRGNARDLPALVAGLERTFAPSIEIYRDAMGTGPADVRIRGAYGLAMTYLAIAERARAAVDPQNRATRRALEPLLAADLRAACAAFEEVGFLAEDYPMTRANPVVVSAIRGARFEARLLRR